MTRYTVLCAFDAHFSADNKQEALRSAQAHTLMEQFNEHFTRQGVSDVRAEARFDGQTFEGIAIHFDSAKFNANSDKTYGLTPASIVGTMALALSMVKGTKDASVERENILFTAQDKVIFDGHAAGAADIGEAVRPTQLGAGFPIDRTHSVTL